MLPCPQTHRAKSQSEDSSFALSPTLTLADYLSENLSTRLAECNVGCYNTPDVRKGNERS